MARNIRLIPLQSYVQVLKKQNSPRGILLNIALFIPFGFGISGAIKKKSIFTPFFFSIFLSIFIEGIQYYTGRGIADIDDVISNGLGGLLGALIFVASARGISGSATRKRVLVTITVLLLSAEIGAVVQTYLTPTIKNSQQDFNFIISDIVWEDRVVVSGRCRVYNRETPNYQIILADPDGNKTAFKTEITGDQFVATGHAREDEKYEVLIRFAGHETMRTTIYINGDSVEYVSGQIPEIEGVPETAVLKVYDRSTDTLVYQDGMIILWLVGSDVSDKTEIIYHIYTDEPEKLPENRKKYGFDNRGFRTMTGIELEQIDHYRVFEREVPDEYHIAEVVVGFSTSGKVTWEQNFRVDYEE